MNDQRILVIEDDTEIRELLASYLAQAGFIVDTLPDGNALMAANRHRQALFATTRPDLVILDVMLPGEDGLSICRRLRESVDIPVIMLTARRDDIDRIIGLEIGADDYLCKPFNPRELLARIKAVLRRSASGSSHANVLDWPGERYQGRDITVDVSARKAVTRHGSVIELTTTEFDLLICFMKRPRTVLSRDALLDATYRRSEESFDRSVDVTVSRLRAKLTGAGLHGTGLIKTVRNLGYLFDDTVESC